MEKLNKIIYFDKETINNILQESNRGIKSSQTRSLSSFKGSSEAVVEGKIKLNVPFINRLSFLFSGKLSASYIKELDKTITVSTTEISEFEKLKEKLIKFENIRVNDIENSSTFFRVAGGYLNMVKGGVEGVDIKEFNSILNEYDGYDTYKVDERAYVRFNNTAFVSNYKRNDLLTTSMTIYCIPVGEFPYAAFDFIQQINKMQVLISGIDTSSTLADYFPPQIDDNIISEEENNSEIITTNLGNNKDSKIKLYDVLYASISVGEEDE